MSRVVALALALAGFAGCSAYDSSLLPRRANSIDGADAAVVCDAGRDASTADGGDAGDAAPGDECTTHTEFPTCTRPNSETTCVNGTCLLVSCAPPFVDCDGRADNGCEARLDSPEHCGLCNSTCRFAHGVAGCVVSRCVLDHCESGFGDCDGSADNGCETALDSLDHCGECKMTCAAPTNAAAGCNGGVCGVGSCQGAFGDCNGDTKDGCEQPLNTPTHCHACDQGCSPANAAGTCASGECVVATCQGSFVDCNGLVSDGCEATLDSVEHCGACGTRCALPNTAAEKCDTAATNPVCVVDHACAAGASSCVPDAPENGCAPGYGDCDHDPKNGCETSLSDLRNCSACGNSCVQANTVTACSAGECSVVGCVPGYDQCVPGEACRSLASDAQHCGQCTRSCSGTTAKCAGGVCTGQVCASGKADCDGQSGNGCETDLSSAGNCGVCGHTCGPFANASAACKSGSCGIGQCNAGYADCDGDVSNGCEVDIHTLNACGGCNQLCSIPNAQASCAAGACTLVACNQGRADCNSSLTDGCETDLTLPDHCGTCGNDCRTLPNVLSSGCGPSGCQYTCQSGRADCDGKAANGCETDLTAAQTCGACGNNCGALAHVVSAACLTGTCKNLVCGAGWGDCDGDPKNGCERSLRTLTDCASCNQACAPAHATASCAVGQCQITACDTGFDNCNGNVADGCEGALSDPAHCGSCTNKCPGSFACVNGQCACTADTDCSGGFKCCGGKCTDAGGACFFPLLCIPGTARTNNGNCGGCGVLCPLFYCCST